MALTTLLLASALTFAPMQQTQQEVVETPIVEEDKSFVEEVKEWADQYFNLNVILGAVNGVVSSGAIFTALGVYISKRKQNKTIEKAVIETLNAQLGTSFTSFKDGAIKEFIRKQDITQDTLKLMIKALVLAQDKTAEGKKALVDLMLECNEKLDVKDTETTKVLEKAKAEIEKEQIKVEKTQEKVKDTYVPVD